MKNIGKILVVASMAFCALFVTGCGSKKESNDVNKNTVATKLVEEFKTSIKSEKDIEKIATKISESSTIKIGVGTMPVEEGLLDGFDGEIKGFNKGYAIKPMIGSQPFVAYVFESSDSVSLEKTLKEKANKRWNICTEADDLETAIVDNYVFLIMSPSNFEE